MRIIGTGSVVGEKRIDNNEMFLIDRGFQIESAKQSLKKKDVDVDSMSDIEIYDAHVQQISGIRTRYFTDKTVEELGAEASILALQAAGVSSKDLDMIVLSTFTEDKKIPNPALTVANYIGNANLAGNTPNAACAGFIHGLRVAYREISSGDVSRILVVSAEKLSAYTDYSDYKTAFLFGDGAGAVVLEATKEGGMSSVPYIGAEYSEEHIGLKTHGLIEMGGGAKVLAKAVKAMEKSLAMALLYERHPQRIIDHDPSMCDRLLGNKGLLAHYCKDIDWVIPHPANLRIFQNLRERFSGIIDSQKFLENIIDEGNISGASIPRILDLNIRNGKIQRGDKVILTAVGGGYTFGGGVFEY